MIAGLPGTGLGGLFYLLAAIGMPIRASLVQLRTARGAARWSLIGRQLLLAGLMVAVLWLTGEGVGWIMVRCTAWGAHLGIFQSLHLQTSTTGNYQVLNVSILLWSFLVLMGLHIVLYLLKLAHRCSKWLRARHTAG